MEAAPRSCWTPAWLTDREAVQLPHDWEAVASPEPRKEIGPPPIGKGLSCAPLRACGATGIWPGREEGVSPVSAPAHRGKIHAQTGIRAKFQLLS